MKRRRFLALSAAALLPGRTAARQVWSGHALGAEARITLTGPPELTEPALAAIRKLLASAEALFSLYDPQSALVRLNRDGRLDAPPPTFLALMREADRVHELTSGLFDPTVQPLWRALAEGGDIDRARDAIGWNLVQMSSDMVRLAPGQALTFNGIAQGFVTDLAADSLRASGFSEVLIDIGELRALGGPWNIGVQDPQLGATLVRPLTDGAIATSSPGAMAVGGQSHILGPGGTAPVWSTVTVESSTATRADALSTAFTLADKQTIRAILPQAPDVHGVTLIDAQGNISTL